MHKTKTRGVTDSPQLQAAAAHPILLLVFFSLLPFVSSISVDKAAECRLTL